MTIYSLQVITTTGYPYYDLEIEPLPKGVPLYLRFFDFSTQEFNHENEFNPTECFELTSGFVSAIFEFARLLDKNLKVLEFIPLRKNTKRSNKSQEKQIKKQSGNVLITCQTETYLNSKAVKQKVQMIFDWVIKNKIPLGTEKKINLEEKERIIRILTDAKAKEQIEAKKDELTYVFNKFLNEMEVYGLEGVCVTSFDLSPIISFGINFKSVADLLRNLGKIPEVETLRWKYRESIIGDLRKWIYIVNSGVGPSEESIFMPYYYILFASPESFLGESPGILASKINLILG